MITVGRVWSYYYIYKGPDNDAADALIRTLLMDSDITERNITREYLSEIYGVNKLDGNKLPLT